VLEDIESEYGGAGRCGAKPRELFMHKSNARFTGAVLELSMSKRQARYFLGYKQEPACRAR
jgi:hypothetical protein